jgi:DNA-binding HxlR family transcriptional regulator
MHDISNSLDAQPRTDNSSGMTPSRRTLRAKHRNETGVREHFLEIFRDEWAIEMLQTLDRSPKLYAEIKREFRFAPQTMLTQTLLNLQNAGLVWRKAYPTSPARVEYSLTALGKSFISPLAALCAWAEQHEPELSAASVHRGKRSKPKARVKNEYASSKR